MASGAPAKICFERPAKDGRVIRLMKDRYDDHVLDEHPDLLRDFDYPASEIAKALETADQIKPGEWGNTQVYIGPVIYPTKGPFTKQARRMHVVVWREANNRGHVITGFSVPEKPKPAKAVK